MYFHLLAVLPVVLILPFEVVSSNIQDVKDPWSPIIRPRSIRSTIIPPASRLISPLIPSIIPPSSHISILPESSPIHISIPPSIPIGSITPLTPHIPIPSIPPHLAEIHRVKRRVRRGNFFRKLGKSIEKAFHKVRDAVLPAAGAAIAASIVG